jgi:hypothetical protein
MHCQKDEGTSNRDTTVGYGPMLGAFYYMTEVVARRGYLLLCIPYLLVDRVRDRECHSTRNRHLDI